jgi:hypothetical protein
MTDISSLAALIQELAAGTHIKHAESTLERLLPDPSMPQLLLQLLGSQPQPPVPLLQMTCSVMRRCLDLNYATWPLAQRAQLRQQLLLLIAHPQEKVRNGMLIAMKVAPHTSHLTPHTSHLTPHTSHLTPHTSHLTPHTSHLTPHTRCFLPPQPIVKCDWPTHWLDMPQQLFQLMSQLHAQHDAGIIGPLKFLADHSESFLLHKDNANACVAGFGPLLLQLVTADGSHMQARVAALYLMRVLVAHAEAQVKRGVCACVTRHRQPRVVWDAVVSLVTCDV